MKIPTVPTSIVWHQNQSCFVIGALNGTVCTLKPNEKDYCDPFLVHRAAVSVLAVNPDASYLLSASSDAMISFIDLGQMNVWSSICLHKAPITCVSWADGAHFATTDSSGRVVVWELPKSSSKHSEHLDDDICTAVQDHSQDATLSGPIDTFWVDFGSTPPEDIPLVEPIMSGDEVPLVEPLIDFDGAIPEAGRFPSVEAIETAEDQFPTVEAEADDNEVPEVCWMEDVDQADNQDGSEVEASNNS
jgi:WD40 repeat protein